MILTTAANYRVTPLRVFQKKGYPLKSGASAAFSNLNALTP